MSYSQVRAATRAATPSDEQRWVEMAAHSTAGQLERLARGVRRARRSEQDAADPEAAAYRMRATKRYDEDGTAVFTVRMPAEQAAVLDAALAQVQADLDRTRGSADDATVGPDARARGLPTTSPRDADAARDARRRGAGDGAGGARASAADSPSASRRSRSALVAQIDPLTGWGRLRDGEVLPPSSLRTVLRTLPGRRLPGTRGRLTDVVRLRRLADGDLRQHDAGRRRRRPGLLLRELLGTLDGERCRFPGCTRHRRLHAHHVVPWADGGRTDLDNLVLLCPRHHVLLHSQGFGLVLRADRRLEVTTSRASSSLTCRRCPGRRTELDPDGRVSAETLPPPLADQRLDLGYAVMVLVQQAA